MYFLSHTRRTAIINENKSFGRFCIQNSKMALHARYVSKGLDIKLLSVISKMPGYKAICSLTRVG